MPHAWKTEYHVIASNGDAVDWLDDEDEAVAKARDLKAIRVEAVTSYLDDREQVWPVDADGDDD